MFFRILKHDLKKKKVMNTIILLFIVLATVFSASGLNNIVTVMSGTDYYFDKAGLNNYFIISKKNDSVLEILDNNSCVKSYKVDENYMGTKKNLDLEKKDIDMQSTVFFQTLEHSSIKFFDKDDNELTYIEKGKVYITGNVIEDNYINPGDKISVVLGDEKVELEVAGKAKDALLGSKFMGNVRFLINEDDYKKVEEYSKEANLERCNIFYVDTNNEKEMKKVLTDASQILFSGSISIVKLSYVMDMIVAFIILILSICLVVLALFILKFTITFTINEEFREIGVMKAIGVNNQNIRRLYIVKYMSLALVGALVGFFISIPFGKLLIDSSAKNMVLGNTSGFILNVIGAAFVVLVTIVFAYLYTRKVRKASPVDAIRNGQTGERYKKKTLYKMKNSHLRLNLYLAINDILSNPRRFITIIISLFVCLIFVFGVVITTDTMKSKNLISTFATESDLYFTSDDGLEMFEYQDKDEVKDKRIAKYKKLMEDAGLPCDICIDLLYKNNVTFNEETYKITCSQGVNIDTKDYTYIEGIAPIKENEIAITDKVSEMTGAKIGDTLTIDLGGEEREFIVTAYFQTLNSLGEMIRFTEEVPTNFSTLSGSNMFQLDFKDNPDDEEIINRRQKVKDVLEVDDVYTASEYCQKNVGVAETMEAVQYLLLTITIIVVILVTLLMELSFVTNERSQIALLKAIGFRDSQIIKWHVYRFLIATIIAIILARILALPITRLWCNPIFGMMGANDIDYFVNPSHLNIIYPGIVLGATIIIAFIASLTTKKIKSSDTANIE